MPSSLLDQSDLADRADKLVAAARRAGADQADALADEMLDIADDSSLDPNDRRIRISSPPDGE